MGSKLDGILQKHFTNSFRKGYITTDGVTMPLRFQEMQEKVLNWNVNEEDVWICSFPKTGTTWTQEMVWMILNDLNFEKGKINLSTRSPFLEVAALYDFRQLVKELEGFVPFPHLEDSLEFTKNQKSPLCIKTHLPFNLQPKEIQSGAKKPKIIYISRNPKDTCTSYYHHAKLIEGYTGNFEDFCRLFLAGKLSYAPYWNHVLPFWNRRSDPNVLFLTYEEMKHDLRSVIKKTANFLGKNLSNEEIDTLTEHLSFESMKRNSSVNYEGIMEMNKRFNLINYEGEFMRSGRVGGYKNEMVPEVILQFDEWIKKNVENTDFTLY